MKLEFAEPTGCGAARGPCRAGGQYRNLKICARVTLCLRREADNRLHLLNPNGWKPVW